MSDKVVAFSKLYPATTDQERGIMQESDGSITIIDFGVSRSLTIEEVAAVDAECVSQQLAYDADKVRREREAEFKLTDAYKQNEMIIDALLSGDTSTLSEWYLGIKESIK